jgi:hypothetical protein
MDAFCTIITANYYPRALALYKSIRRFDPDLTLQVLVADDQPVSKPAFDQIKLVYAKDLHGYNLTEALYRRYAHINIDLFRWSMKVFLPVWENGFSRIPLIAMLCE